MEEKKWNPERVRQEVYDARTKLFVVAKVLETGSLDFSGHQEWTAVIRPMLKEVVELSGQIGTLIEEKHDTDAPSNE